MLSLFGVAGRNRSLFWLFLSAWAEVAAQPAPTSPKIGLLQWSRGENPLWAPRLERGMARLIEADSGFAGAPPLAPRQAQLKRDLNPQELAAGGAKSLATEFAVDHFVHLELPDLTPQHRVERHKWKLWEAAESWGLPLRLTVWDGKSGRVIYDARVPGTVTVREKSFWPYRDFAAMTFEEQERRRELLLDTTLSAAKDTLARILLGRKFVVPGDTLAASAKSVSTPAKPSP